MLARFFKSFTFDELLTARLLFVEELFAERFIAVLRLVVLAIFGTGFFINSWPYNSEFLNLVVLTIVGVQLVNCILPNIESFFNRGVLLSTIAIDAFSVLALFLVIAEERSFKAAVNDEALVYLQIMFLAFQAVRLSLSFILFAAAILLAGRFLIYSYFRFIVEAGVSYDGSASSAIMRYVAIAVLLLIFTFVASRAKALASRALEEYLQKNDLLIKNKELNELATVDELTGLYNHRFFHEELSRLLQKSRTAKQSLALALIDLDNFKSANDTHGHKTGDAILKKVASILQQVSADSDICARYGGDELCLIMPGKNRYQAREQLEKIRAAVEEEFKASEKITLSIGIAHATNRKRPGAQKLILYADRAMYRAKRRGKNQVQLF